MPNFFYKEFSNDDVNRYLYDAEPCASTDEASEWIDFYLEPEPRKQQRWIIISKDSGEKMGTCGFHCYDKEAGEAEIGYDLYPTYWKKGYAKELLKKIIKFAKDVMNVETIYAHISIDNNDSIKTTKKLGFERTGEQYYEEFHDQKYLHDIYCLKIK